MTVTSEQAAQFEETIATGGIAIFPTDTLYGIAADPQSAAAVDRINELKGRPPAKPSAVMFFDVQRLLESMPELDGPTITLIEQLLPGPFTLVVRNPNGRFAPACAGDPSKIGLRVPMLGGMFDALGNVQVPVVQTSANKSGGPDVTAVEDIDPEIRAGVDLVIDGGPLLGVASTVADVSELSEGRWRLLRAPIPRASGRLTELLGPPAA
ncbi:MAG TPA: L-threonylcarbamoyladenylate synthase [Solirubrobacterales bacterium]|jgi:L-threonylcarbamoyladenylate synthase|nr:L-threonylcarbamoyladenylate synthase [Solirubrobacterales bacterium]